MRGEVISRYPEPAQATPGAPCHGLRFDRDLEGGDPVSVAVGDREVGTASLMAGEWRAGSNGRKGTCVFRFVVSELPHRNCYGVGVGDRPTIPVTLEQVSTGVVDVSSDSIGPAACDYTQ